MVSNDLLTSWVALSPMERAVVSSVYFRRRSIADTARLCSVGVSDVGRSLTSAYRRIAQNVLDDRTGENTRPASPLPDRSTG